MPREKNGRRVRRRDTSRSSVSSDDSYKKKKSKSKHKRRSRSRDRSEADSSYSVSSRSKHKSRRRDSRSSSRHRHSQKSKRRSNSRDRVKAYRRSPSRERARSGSSSRSKQKSSRRDIKSYRRRSHSDSSSSEKSSHSVKPAKIFAKINSAKDDIESKVEKAIKAAEAAGLTMSRLPAYEYKEVEVREDMPTIHDRNLLDELNSDIFIPKQFTSIKNIKLPDNLVIDLDSEMVQGPAEVPKLDSLFHPSLFPDEETQKAMWIKKLLKHRRMMLRGDL